MQTEHTSTSILSTVQLVRSLRPNCPCFFAVGFLYNHCNTHQLYYHCNTRHLISCRLLNWHVPTLLPFPSLHHPSTSWHTFSLHADQREAPWGSMPVTPIITNTNIPSDTPLLGCFSHGVWTYGSRLDIMLQGLALVARPLSWWLVLREQQFPSTRQVDISIFREPTHDGSVGTY